MDRIRFEGTSAKEAEEFIATVRGVALKEGKHKDQEWIAFFASSCFVGLALRWLEDLDSEVLCDWNLLRRAILRKWPTEDDANISVIPAAAAAAAPPHERLALQPSQTPPFLRCTSCGRPRLSVDQDVCGQQCGSAITEFVPASMIVGSNTEEYPGRMTDEGKKSQKTPPLAPKWEQREAAPRGAHPWRGWGEDDSWAADADIRDGHDWAAAARFARGNTSIDWAAVLGRGTGSTGGEDSQTSWNQIARKRQAP